MSGRIAVLAVLSVCMSSCGDSCSGCDGGEREWWNRRGSVSGLHVEEVQPTGTAPGRLPLIQATFDDVLDVATVGPAAMEVRDAAGAIAGTVAPLFVPNGDCLGVTFTPAAPLAIDTCYTVTITTALTDRDGDTLEAPYSWTFCVDPLEFYTWREPVTFDEHSSDGEFPTLALDPFRGVATVVWVELPGDRVQLWARHRDGGSGADGWTVPTLLTAENGVLDAPHAACSPFGDGIVAMPAHDTATDRRALVLRPFRPSGDADGIYWATSRWVGDAAGEVEHPRVAVDLEQRVLAVFEMRPASGGERGIYAVRSDRDRPTFYDPELLQAVTVGRVARPRMAMNPEGSAFVVWEIEDHPLPYQIRGARFLAGVAGPDAWTFNGSLDETPFNGYARDPAIAMDADDNAFVVWARDDETESQVMTIRFAAADTAPPAPVDLSAGLVGRAVEPHVVVDSQGHAIAVWVQDVDRFEHSIIAMRYVPGVGWTDRATIFTSTTEQHAPFVAIGPAGDAIVVWHDFEVRASHFFGGTMWTDAVTLSRQFSVEDASRPRVAIDGLGRAVAVWQQQEYGPIRTTVRAAVFE